MQNVNSTDDDRQSVRVLILSATVGMGHWRAGEALRRAYALQNKSIEVRHEDILDFANPSLKELCHKSYAQMANSAPQLLGFLYDYSDKTFSSETHGIALERLITHGVTALIADYAPDIVISTHSLPADIISWLLCNDLTNALHAVVLTDFDVHPVWLCHHYARYFVAIDETKEHLVKLGFDPERVSVTGIPIDPTFELNKGQAEMRHKHGLASNYSTILISAGGMGLGPMREILPSLLDLTGSNQIIAACGSNQELEEEMEQLCEERKDRSDNLVKVIGFTTEMDEYMEAADILLGKPGGLMSSEALAKGLAFVIVSPIPGQEERNADHLLEEGAAIRCNNMPALTYKVNRLLHDRARLSAMKERALAMSHPHSAQQIAKELLELHKCGASNSTHPIAHKCKQPFRFNIEP